MNSKDQHGNGPITAIHLYNIGDYIFVAVERNGEWKVVIKEYAPLKDVAISHINENP